jgi:hypothetical protein
MILLGGINFISLLTVVFFLPETSRRVQEHHQGKGKQSLLEDLQSFKDWLMTKLILTYSIGSFCNGGLLVAMVLFYSLSVEVGRCSQHTGNAFVFSPHQASWIRL